MWWILNCNKSTLERAKLHFYVSSPSPSTSRYWLLPLRRPRKVKEPQLPFVAVPSGASARSYHLVTLIVLFRITVVRI